MSELGRAAHSLRAVPGGAVAAVIHRGGWTCENHSEIDSRDGERNEHANSGSVSERFSLRAECVQARRIRAALLARFHVGAQHVFNLDALPAISGLQSACN